MEFCEISPVKVAADLGGFHFFFDSRKETQISLERVLTHFIMSIQNIGEQNVNSKLEF